MADKQACFFVFGGVNVGRCDLSELCRKLGEIMVLLDFMMEEQRASMKVASWE